MGADDVMVPDPDQDSVEDAVAKIEKVVEQVNSNWENGVTGSQLDEASSNVARSRQDTRETVLGFREESLDYSQERELCRNLVKKKALVTPKEYDLATGVFQKRWASVAGVLMLLDEDEVALQVNGVLGFTELAKSFPVANEKSPLYEAKKANVLLNERDMRLDIISSAGDIEYTHPVQHEHYRRRLAMIQFERWHDDDRVKVFAFRNNVTTLERELRRQAILESVRVVDNQIRQVYSGPVCKNVWVVAKREWVADLMK